MVAGAKPLPRLLLPHATASRHSESVTHGQIAFAQDFATFSAEAFTCLTLETSAFSDLHVVDLHVNNGAGTSSVFA